jgi:hypothetical protein
LPKLTSLYLGGNPISNCQLLPQKLRDACPNPN